MKYPCPRDFCWHLARRFNSNFEFLPLSCHGLRQGERESVIQMPLSVPLSVDNLACNFKWSGFIFQNETNKKGALTYPSKFKQQLLPDSHC